MDDPDRMNPYPTTTLDYRVSQLEEWKRTLEQEGLAKAFAIADERWRVMKAEMDEQERRLDLLWEERQQRMGWSSKAKTWITVGLVTLIMASGLLLQLVTYLRGA